MVSMKITCKHCGEQFNFNVSNDQFVKYMEKGDLIQNIFPEMNDDDKELFISRTCSKCWDEIFGDEEDHID